MTLIHDAMYRQCMPAATATLTHTAALARLGHTLSDATRAGVLLALREAPGYPSDLAVALGVSRQVMSNQLACLRRCGLVESVPDGRRSWYRLTDGDLTGFTNTSNHYYVTDSLGSVVGQFSATGAFEGGYS